MRLRKSALAAAVVLFALPLISGCSRSGSKGPPKSPTAGPVVHMPPTLPPPPTLRPGQPTPSPTLPF